MYAQAEKPKEKKRKFTNNMKIRAIQRAKMNPNGGTWTAKKSSTMPTPHDSVGKTTGSTLTGCAEETWVSLTQQSVNSDPVDLNDQSKWSAYDVLLDPNRDGYDLTRMHQINGYLFGPKKNWNMFLGTMKANTGGGDDSHYYGVEEVIKNWVAQSNGQCEYNVEPTFDDLPPYMQARITKAKTTHAGSPTKLTTINDFEKWAKKGIPTKYKCTAVFVNTLTGQEMTEVRTLKADEGYASDPHKDKFSNKL